MALVAYIILITLTLAVLAPAHLSQFPLLDDDSVIHTLRQLENTWLATLSDWHTPSLKPTKLNHPSPILPWGVAVQDFDVSVSFELTDEHLTDGEQVRILRVISNPGNEAFFQYHIDGRSSSAHKNHLVAPVHNSQAGPFSSSSGVMFAWYKRCGKFLLVALVNRQHKVAREHLDYLESLGNTALQPLCALDACQIALREISSEIMEGLVVKELEVEEDVRKTWRIVIGVAFGPDHDPCQ